MQLKLTRNQKRNAIGSVFTLRCDVIQSEDETTRFERYNLKSPLQWVVDILPDLTSDAMGFSCTYDTAQQALDQENALIQFCRNAMQALIVSEHYGGSDTIGL